MRWHTWLFKINRRLRKNRIEVLQKRRRRMLLEGLEPRMLLAIVNDDWQFAVSVTYTFGVPTPEFEAASTAASPAGMQVPIAEKGARLDLSPPLVGAGSGSGIRLQLDFAVGGFAAQGEGEGEGGEGECSGSGSSSQSSSNSGSGSSSCSGSTSASGSSSGSGSGSNSGSYVCSHDEAGNVVCVSSSASGS